MKIIRNMFGLSLSSKVYSVKSNAQMYVQRNHRSHVHSNANVPNPVKFYLPLDDLLWEELVDKLEVVWLRYCISF